MHARRLYATGIELPTNFFSMCRADDSCMLADTRAHDGCTRLEASSHHGRIDPRSHDEVRELLHRLNAASIFLC
jgi:hypothetical protein